MTEPTVRSLEPILTSMADIIQRQQFYIRELQDALTRHEKIVVAGLDLILDTVPYNDFFQTEGQALIAYNLRSWLSNENHEPVSKLPGHLKKRPVPPRPVRKDEFNPAEAKE